MKNSNIINLLGIDLDKHKLITIAGPCASDKSTIITTIACREILDGKRVLFITEDRGNFAARRIREILNDKGLGLGENQVHILDGYHDNTNLKIIEIFDVMGQYDLIVVDTPTDIDFKAIQNFCVKNKCAMIFSKQVFNDLYKREEVIKSDFTNSITQSSDYVLSLSRIVKKNTIWDRIINFICFWKKPANINLKIIKNRYGKSFDVKTNIEF